MTSAGRSYAGVLAVLAFLVTLCRGISHAHTASDTITNSLVALVAFAVIGGLIGWIGERSITDSVKRSIVQEEA